MPKAKTKNLSSDRGEVIAPAPVSVTVDIISPKKTEPKTVVITSNNHGLLSLRFKEGGTLPDILKGDFCSVKDIELSITVYCQRTSKHFNLDTDILVAEDPGAFMFEELAPAASEVTE